MAQFVVETRALALTGAALLITVAVAATIGYNLGYGRGSTQPPATDLARPGAPGASPTLPGASPPAANPYTQPAEVTLSGDVVEVAGSTVLNGIVRQPTATGFELEVTSQVLNTSTGERTTKVTAYAVAITRATKVVQQTTTVVVPGAGAVPQVTSTTKNIAVSELKDSQQVTVTTNDPATAKTITALEVRVVKVVKDWS